MTPVDGSTAPVSAAEYKTPTGAVTSTVDTIEYAKRRQVATANMSRKPRFLLWWVSTALEDLSAGHVCVGALFFVAS